MGYLPRSFDQSRPDREVTTRTGVSITRVLQFASKANTDLREGTLRCTKPGALPDPAHDYVIFFVDNNLSGIGEMF
jgi:hypothetical protein